VLQTRDKQALGATARASTFRSIVHKINSEPELPFLLHEASLCHGVDVIRRCAAEQQRLVGKRVGNGAPVAALRDVNCKANATGELRQREEVGRRGDGGDGVSVPAQDVTKKE
jgi:hypothetical protein